MSSLEYHHTTSINQNDNQMGSHLNNHIENHRTKSIKKSIKLHTPLLKIDEEIESEFKQGIKFTSETSNKNTLKNGNEQDKASHEEVNPNIKERRQTTKGIHVNELSRRDFDKTIILEKGFIVNTSFINKLNDEKKFIGTKIKENAIHRRSEFLPKISEQNEFGDLKPQKSRFSLNFQSRNLGSIRDSFIHKGYILKAIENGSNSAKNLQSNSDTSAITSGYHQQHASPQLPKLKLPDIHNKNSRNSQYKLKFPENNFSQLNREKSKITPQGSNNNNNNNNVKHDENELCTPISRMYSQS